jgi:hypothetical protein
MRLTRAQMLQPVQNYDSLHCIARSADDTSVKAEATVCICPISAHKLQHETENVSEQGSSAASRGGDGTSIPSPEWRVQHLRAPVQA